MLLRHLKDYSDYGEKGGGCEIGYQQHQPEHAGTCHTMSGLSVIIAQEVLEDPEADALAEDEALDGYEEYGNEDDAIVEYLNEGEYQDQLDEQDLGGEVYPDGAELDEGRSPLSLSEAYFSVCTVAH